MTPKKLLENLYAIAYALPEQERRFFCALEPAIDPNTHGEISAGHQLALLIRAIRTDMAQQYQREDKRRTSAAALRRIGKASASKQGKLRPHFAGAFLDEQGRQCVTDGFTLLRLNTPSTVLQWAPPPNDPHVYDTIPELLNSDGATVTLNLPTAAEVRAKIASDKAKYKAESHPAGDTLSTCFSWGDGLPMVNAMSCPVSISIARTATPSLCPSASTQTAPPTNPTNRRNTTYEPHLQNDRHGGRAALCRAPVPCLRRLCSRL